MNKYNRCFNLTFLPLSTEKTRLNRLLGKKTMTIINFKEIPQANTGSGDQDAFKLFARDFLKYLG
jgi:hypothetical protein